MIFHVQAHLEKCREKTVTIPTFVAQFPITLEIVYQLEYPDGYYHPLEKKGKNNRKRSSTQRINMEEGQVQATP